MINKFLYSFSKDGLFRVVCVLSIIGIILCLVLLRLCVWQNFAIKNIQEKQALIAQIPYLEARIIHPKVIVKGQVLTLNGIISDKNQLVAAINDTFVKIGDKIGDKKVTAITGYTVTLCDEGSVDKCINMYLDK